MNICAHSSFLMWFFSSGRFTRVQRIIRIPSSTNSTLPLIRFFSTTILGSNLLTPDPPPPCDRDDFPGLSWWTHTEWITYVEKQTWRQKESKSRSWGLSHRRTVLRFRLNGWKIFRRWHDSSLRGAPHWGGKDEVCQRFLQQFYAPSIWWIPVVRERLESGGFCNNTIPWLYKPSEYVNT